MCICEIFSSYFSCIILKDLILIKFFWIFFRIFINCFYNSHNLKKNYMKLTIEISIRFQYPIARIKPNTSTFFNTHIAYQRKVVMRRCSQSASSYLVFGRRLRQQRTGNVGWQWSRTFSTLYTWDFIEINFVIFAHRTYKPIL